MEARHYEMKKKNNKYIQRILEGIGKVIWFLSFRSYDMLEKRNDKDCILDSWKFFLALKGLIRPKY